MLRKTTSIIAAIMAVVLMTSILSVTAFAVNNTATVYVNNNKTDIAAYIDEYGLVWIEDTYGSVPKLFPDETKGEFFPAIVGYKSLLNEWADEYGYSMSVSGSNVYLSKTVTKPLKLVVNGLNVDVSLKKGDNGTIYLTDTYNSIPKIFPTESKDEVFPAVVAETVLKEWADKYKYTMLVEDNLVFLNNDGSYPIVIYENENRIEFDDVYPFIKDGRTLIPARVVSESLGLSVEWVQETRNVIIRDTSGKTVILTIDAHTYFVDGVPYSLDVPAQIIAGRTVVPIRFVCESFGYNVSWNADQAVRVITLTK